MKMKKTLGSLVVALVIALLVAIPEIIGRTQASAPEAPEPSGPVLPRITSPEQLVPFAKIILQRDYIGQRLGWGIKGGERVLLVATNLEHPWVIEAFVQALHELNCPVDVVVYERQLVEDERGTKEWAEKAIRLKEERLSKDFNTIPEKQYPGWGGSGTPRPRSKGMKISKEDLEEYDVVMGPVAGPRNQEGLAGGFWWVRTPETMAGPGVLYPGELLDLIDQKTWEVVRVAERVDVTGLQGTDFTFSWFPEWWELVEGTHEKIRSPGHMSTFNALHPGRSEHAVFAGHLMLHPRYGAIEGTDAKGVITSQFGEWDPMWPPLTIHLDRGEITKIEEGGHYGDFWKKSLELTKDILYPGHSRPGTGWMMEFSLGTNPKIFGPTDIEELRGVDRRDLRNMAWGDGRDRAGFIHAGYGARGASWWAEIYQMPVNHYHQFLPFITYDVTTRDGRKVRLIDKGRLTILDDPEVRALAAKFGDPDEMLSSDWVPVMTPEGKIIPPKGRLVPYEEYIQNLPYKLDDPRLIYRIPEKLKKFYGEDRVTYYNPEEYMDFYRKIGQIPVKRVKTEN